MSADDDYVDQFLTSLGLNNESEYSPLINLPTPMLRLPADRITSIHINALYIGGVSMIDKATWIKVGNAGVVAGGDALVENSPIVIIDNSKTNSEFEKVLEPFLKALEAQTVNEAYAPIIKGAIEGIRAEAAKPAAQRDQSTVKTLLETMKAALGALPALSTAWKLVKGPIGDWFGLPPETTAV